jgi:hypothetical protein
MRCLVVFFAVIIHFSAKAQNEEKKILSCIPPIAAVFPAKFGSIQQLIAKEFVQPDAVPDSSFIKKGSLRFIIDKNGNPGGFKIIEQLGYNCDEEIIRILKLVKWIPASYRGEPMEDLRILPYTIEFEKSTCDEINSNTSQLLASSDPHQKPLAKYE